MNEPLISVIVPVYKVEPYLRRCLDSVICQTYHNLQIILVEDGSPDACGAICDAYAARDARIQVIHKTNGGLSSARNAGLAAASGEWIGWVDGDDWIEPDMYEYLLDGATRTEADIAVCGTIEHRKYYRSTRKLALEQLLDSEQAMGHLLRNDLLTNSVWNKLYRRELFAKLVFPEGRTYEDMALMYKLFERAKRVVHLTEAKYNYLFRDGSILADVSLSNRYDFYLVTRQRLDDMLPRWPQYRGLLEAQCFGPVVSLWSCYWQNPKDQRQKYLPLLKGIAKDARIHYKSTVRNIKLGPSGRMVLRLTPYANGAAFALALVFSLPHVLKHGRPL